MDRISRWKLADGLNVYQIALLTAGYDPSEFESDNYSKWPEEVRIEISPYLIAIKNAARSGKIIFKEILEGWGEGNTTSWEMSIVDIDSLCDWMRSRNFQDGFFIPDENDVDSLSNPVGDFYAPKLSAAVHAWNEVTADPESLNGKTPKRALEVWLRKHANEYGLTNKDGNPNELGIEEICKVANWKPAGGASPTPTATITPPVKRSGWIRKARPNPTIPRLNPPTGKLNPPTPPAASSSLNIDDDIPF
jgi:hypothetical protein